VIAILSLIGSVFVLLMFGGFFVYGAVKIPNKLNSTEEMILLTNGLLVDYVEKTVSAANSTTVDDEKFYQEDLVELLQQSISYVGIHLSMAWIFVAVFNIVASIELLQGVRQKNYWRCNAWFNWYGAYLLMTTVTTVVSAVFIYENWLYKVISFCIGILISLYFMFVVHTFMKELKNDEKQQDRK